MIKKVLNPDPNTNSNPLSLNPTPKSIYKHSKNTCNRYFRESCGLGFTKDLLLCNDDPRKVLIIDNSATAYMHYPNNAIPIDDWYFNRDDKQLLELIGLPREDARVLPSCRRPLPTLEWAPPHLSYRGPSAVYGGAAASTTFARCSDFEPASPTDAAASSCADTGNLAAHRMPPLHPPILVVLHDGPF